LERAAGRLSPPERKLLELEENFEEVLRRVSDLDLREGRKFRIRRGGKEREVVIPSPESKLLQYILLERIELPKRAVSFSRPGKGGPGAIQLLMQKLGADDWLLRMDIRDFFPSVPHRLLRKRIPQCLEEPIMAVVKASGSGDCGIPLGNPLSNTLAELYLSKADRKLGLACRFAGCTGIRYVDDYLVAGAREDVKRVQNLIIGELERLGLEINGEKTILVTRRHGVDFLGYHISTTITVRRETRDNMLKTLGARYFEESEGRFWGSVAGMHGHACWSSDPITQLTAMCTERNRP
jgi:hypothetical protein